VKLDTADVRFSRHAAEWLASIADHEVVYFERVLERSPGYYPSTLHDLWMLDLARRGLAAIDGPATVASAVTLPVGHPLDYDWRFTEGTRRKLLDALADLTNAGDEVVYFGTPTLFTDAYAELDERSHLLIDSNGAMVRTLQSHLGATAALQLRLGHDPLPAGARADALVLDPPWYSDATNAFLIGASQIVRPGGYVLLSQPTFATRPGVEEERVLLLSSAQGLGLDLVRLDGGSLRYVTPHFERMSLGDVKPSVAIPDDWRRGDLLVFKRAEREVVAPTPRAEMEEPWREVSFGPVRIKLRRAGEVELGEVASGVSRLQTVSRRDPLRAQVGLWTSGNRVRSLENPGGIARLIELCDDDLSDMSFTHQKTRVHAEMIGLDSRVADALFDLLLLEYQEHTAGGYGVLR
jgi:hypothetical protein